MSNSLYTLGLAAFAAFGITFASPVLDLPGDQLDFVQTADAQSYRYMSCGDLWYQRNAIYARQGYCFKTRRAQNVFGRRCYPPYGRLSNSQQRRVNDIVYWERRKGCR